MSKCKYCREDLLDGINLSNGEAIHNKCFHEIEERDRVLTEKIRKEKDSLTKNKDELKRRDSIAFKIVSMFFPSESKSEDIEVLVYAAEKNLSQLYRDLENFKSRVKPIYDYLIDYPPDWEERRRIVLNRDGERCNKCSKYLWNHDFDIHHKIPLSKGGSNKTDNLILLCKRCHSKEHGNRNISKNQIHNNTGFSQRIENIKYAIENGRKIKFDYKKTNEQKYKQRTVLPKELVTVMHHNDGEFTLCIRGFCELRKAERVFALKRMRNLKTTVVSETMQSNCMCGMKHKANGVQKPGRINKPVKAASTAQRNDLTAQAINQHFPDPVSEKIIICCTKCNQKLRIPYGKKLSVFCPKCNIAFIYDGTK